MELVKRTYDYEAQKMLHNIDDDMLSALFDAKAIIAGGIVSRLFSGRDTEEADIDVYFRSKKDVASVLRAIQGTGNIVFDYTDKSVMIKSGDALVQLIIIDAFDSIEAIFEKFDFTIVMGAFDTTDETFYFHPEFFHDNSQRRLVYNPGTMFPIISSLRVQKYAKEGYTISRNEFLKIVISIMDLKIESWDEIERQFGRFYGTNVADIITPELKEQPYSPNKLIEVIDGLGRNYYSYNKEAKVIHDYNAFVVGITGEKIEAYKWGDKMLYKMDSCWVNIQNFDENVFVDTGKECVVNKNKIYKYVVKKNDKTLVSQYRNTFVYKVGENAKDDTNGLWFYYLDGLQSAKNSYGNMANRVLIECEPVRIKVEANFPNSDARFYEVKVLREVPKEEEESLFLRAAEIQPEDLF